MSFLRKKVIKGRTYFYEVESYWKDGKSRQRVLRYVGTADKVARPAEGPAELSVEDSVHFGGVAALHALAQDLGLAQAVDAVSAKGGGPPLGKLFELMVINRCLDPVSRHQLPEWYEGTALPRILDLPASKVTDDVLYNALGYFTEDKVAAIQAALWEALKRKGADASRLFYDITSTYFEGVTAELAEYGYSRDHRRDRLQINLAVTVNPQGFAVTHEVLAGNVADVMTVASAVRNLRSRFGCDGVLVMDRGMMSNDNRVGFEESRTPYIAGVRMHPKLYGFVGDVAEKRFAQASVDDERYWVAEARLEGRRVVVVWNKEKEKDDRAWRENALAVAEQELQALRAKVGTRKTLSTKDEVLRRAQKILQRRGTGMMIGLRVNRQGPPSLDWYRVQDTIDAEAASDGRWLLETNTELPAADVFWAYHERDVVEKYFQAMKSIVELRPIYVHKDVHVKAHVFVCVTSVLLLQVLRERLRKADISLSAMRALRRLDRVMEVAVRRGQDLQYVLTRRRRDQQLLLHAAGVAHT